MLTVKEVQGLAERLKRAEWIAAAKLVAGTVSSSGYVDVWNAGGTGTYLVCITPGNESCSCPDFQQRQKDAGLPCKHMLAVQMARPSLAPVPVADLSWMEDAAL